MSGIDSRKAQAPTSQNMKQKERVEDEFELGGVEERSHINDSITANTLPKNREPHRIAVNDVLLEEKKESENEISNIDDFEKAEIIEEQKQYLEGNADFLEVVRGLKNCALDEVNSDKMLEGIKPDTENQQVFNLQKEGEGPDPLDFKCTVYDLISRQFEEVSFKQVSDARNRYKLDKNQEVQFKRRQSVELQSRDASKLEGESYDFSSRSFTVLFKSITEAQLSEVVQAFNLNPISLWDIMLKLNYDKVHKLSDSEAIFFNISHFTDASKNKKQVYKVVYLEEDSVMLVFTNPIGAESFQKMLEKELEMKDVKLNKPLSPQKENYKNSFVPKMKKQYEDSSDTNSEIEESFQARQKQNLTNLPILLLLLNQPILQIELMVKRFQSERRAINNMALNISNKEFKNFIIRTHMATYTLGYLSDDIRGKIIFLQDILDQAYTPNKLKDMAQFLKGRVVEALVSTKQTTEGIKLAKSTFNQVVQGAINDKSNGMNEAMKAFASIATIFLPLQVISGIFGMNVQIPAQYVEHLYPFYIIIALMFLLSLFIFCFFKKYKWL